MLAEAGGARIPPEPEARVAVIVALGVERGCLGRVGPRVVLAQSGPGHGRAAAAAERALRAGARALVSFGVAGGLASDVGPGRLLLPSQVVTSARRFDVDARWHARLAAALGRAELEFDERPLLGSTDVLDTPAAKRRAAELGVAAVDLESGAIAAAAASAGVPFAIVRAVADGPRDALPAGVSSWVDADGDTRFAPVVAAALQPGNWRSLWTLARRFHAARRTLERAATRLAHEDFLFA